MDDLESLLNEFGVAPDQDVTADDVKSETEADVVPDVQSSKKKKKRKKKKAANSSSSETTEQAGNDGAGKPVDIATVLKSKAKPSKKSNTAAASAAKEAKAKSATSKKDKKKKKDKYAHGAPSR